MKIDIMGQNKNLFNQSIISANMIKYTLYEATYNIEKSLSKLEIGSSKTTILFSVIPDEEWEPFISE